LVQRIISALLPTDYFNVLAFAGGSRVYSTTSVAATAQNINNAIGAVAGYTSGGGTEMLDAFKRGSPAFRGGFCAYSKI